MTREEADFIGAMNMCDEISNEAYKKIMCHCEEQEPCEDAISRADAIANIRILYPDMPVVDIMGARHKWSEKYQQYRDCEKILADLPSIQPKPKTDEPMQVELEADGYSDGKLVYDYGKCPKCGWQFEYGEKDWEEPYCCHCGQKLHWFESEDKG